MRELREDIPGLVGDACIEAWWWLRRVAMRHGVLGVRHESVTLRAARWWAQRVDEFVLYGPVGRGASHWRGLHPGVRAGASAGAAAAIVAMFVSGVWGLSVLIGGAGADQDVQRRFNALLKLEAERAGAGTNGPVPAGVMAAAPIAGGVLPMRAVGPGDRRMTAKQKFDALVKEQAQHPTVSVDRPDDPDAAFVRAMPLRGGGR